MNNINTEQMSLNNPIAIAARLIEEINTNPKTYDNWVNSDKRYKLIMEMSLVGDDFEKNQGVITSHYDVHVSSDSSEDLINIWKNFFSKRAYDTTKAHFIVDMKEKKIINLLSFCA